MKKNIVIAFRGRNTDQILKDFGKEADIIVCREDDDLKQEGDMTTYEASLFLHKETVQAFALLQQGVMGLDEYKARKITLIANGGTTEQQVPFFEYLFSGREGWRGLYEVIQVERDGSIKTLSQRVHPLHN